MSAVSIASAAPAAPRLSAGSTNIRRRGQSGVEAAIILPFVLLLVFGIIDFGRLFYTYATVNHALREGGRYAITGSQLPGTAPGSTMSRIDSVRTIIRQAATNVNLLAINVSSSQGGSNHAGYPRDLVTVSIQCAMPLMTPIIARFFPSGQFRFTATATFRNEPFPRSLANS